MLTLVSEAAEFALDCLEKRDAVVPFCKLRTKSGVSAWICVENEEATFEQVAHAVRRKLKHRLESGDVAEFVLYADKEVKYQHGPAPLRIVEVEFQNGTAESAIYHFPVTVEAGKASVVSQYQLLNLKEKLL